MEPVRPSPSILEAWNNNTFLHTREYLIKKMKNPGGVFPCHDPSIFDCCISCPVAPGQRTPMIRKRLKFFLRDYSRDPSRFYKNPGLLAKDLKKIGNLWKLLQCAGRANPMISAYPIVANISPANLCNLRCPECGVGNGEQILSPESMSLSTYRAVMKELGPRLFALELFRYGEPLLHRDILEMIEIAWRKYGVLVKVSTNFSMDLSDAFLRGLVRSGLTTLIVAADDIEQERYEQYRIRGEVRTVIRNVENLARIKKELRSRTPIIRWQSLIFNFNESRRRVIEKRVKDLGVDEFTFLPSYLSPGNAHLKPSFTPTRGEQSKKTVQVLGAKILRGPDLGKETFILEVYLLQNLFRDPLPPVRGTRGIRLGVKLADRDKREVGDFARILWDRPIQPGERVTLREEFPMPSAEIRGKTAFFKIDLIAEGLFWFEQGLETQSRPFFLKAEFQGNHSGASAQG